MAQMIFVSMPVKDLERSKQFYGRLGYAFNEQFADGTGACVIISEHIYAMLVTHDKFRSLTPREICDATKTAEMLLCLSCESRAQVDELVAKAVAAGGTPSGEPTDYGTMYDHGFYDLDGHGWGLMWMDPAAMQKA